SGRHRCIWHAPFAGCPGSDPNHPDCNGLGRRSCSRWIGCKPRTSGRKRNGDLVSQPSYRSQAIAAIERIIPSAVRVALLFNPNNGANISFRGEIETAERDIGISLIQVEASAVPDLDTNLRGLLGQRADALIVAGVSFLILQIPEIIDFLGSNRIPSMFS